MAEPREFYYPLQDKAADIDRVLHDLIDITDTEESLNMYVKVIEVEGQPHFWFGEGGEKQKPIEIDEWELPTGDGQDWVRKSCIYTPYRKGVNFEDVCDKTKRILTTELSLYSLRYGSSEPTDIYTSYIQKIGQAEDSRSSSPPIVSSSFGDITENIFNNLINENGAITISIEAATKNGNSDFLPCSIDYDSTNNCYNVSLVYKGVTKQVATLNYENGFSNKKEIVIKRQWNNNFGQFASETTWIMPSLKISFIFNGYLGRDFNFNIHQYWYLMSAISHRSSYPDNFTLEKISMDGQKEWTSKQFEQYSSVTADDLVSTDFTIVDGIYNIGPLNDKDPVDVIYFGTLNNGAKIESSISYGGPADNHSEKKGMGITLKKGARIIVEKASLDMNLGAGFLMHGGYVDMSSDGVMELSPEAKWDGTKGGFAKADPKYSDGPSILMHGVPFIQMTNKSSINMANGSAIEMDGEAFLSLHDLTVIDISGAPNIQIHGRENESGGGPEMKYDLSARQPRVELDSGPYISMSGNEASTVTIGSDPYFMMKGSSGIIFNNSRVKNCSGPLLLCNENSFYFDGYGSGGIEHNRDDSRSSKNIIVNPLDLSLEALNEYREYDVEKIVDTLKETNLIEATESNRDTLTRIVTTPTKSTERLNINRNTSLYTEQVGEELEYFLKNETTLLPINFYKYYYVKASKYYELQDIIEEIGDSRITMDSVCVNMNLGSDRNFYGNTIIEDKLNEKGLNFDDFIFNIGYSFYLSYQLQSQFLTYYEGKYGTRTLPRGSVVYRQSYSNAKKTVEFLDKYFDISFTDYADVDEDEACFTMTEEEYNTVKSYYDEYNENKDNPSFYFQEEGNNFNVNEKRFLPLIPAFYRTAHPTFQEKFHAANGTIILGGDDGSTTWAKIGGQVGEHTEFGVLNNAKVWIENNTEVKLNGEAWLNIDKEFGIVLTENKNDYLLPSAAQFVISPAELIDNEWTGGHIAISDRHDQIIFTIDHLRKAINGEASSANNVTYDNTSSGITATNVQDAIDELAAGSGSGGGGTSVYKEEVLWDSTTSTDTQGQYTLSKAITNFDAICFKVIWNHNGVFKFVTVLPVSTLVEEIGTSSKIAVATGDIQYLYIQVSNNNKFIQQDTSNSVSMSKIIGIKYGTSASSLDGVGF